MLKQFKKLFVCLETKSQSHIKTIYTKMISFKSIQRIDLIVNGKVYSKFKFVLLDNSIMLLTPQQFEEMKANK